MDIDEIIEKIEMETDDLEPFITDQVLIELKTKDPTLLLKIYNGSTNPFFRRRIMNFLSR